MRKVWSVIVLALVLALALAALPLADSWVEVRSPHFVVTSNADEAAARHIAGQLERLRLVFHQLFPNLQSDPPLPVQVLALRTRADLRAVEPADYLAKGMLDLAGYFQSTGDRQFILLRMDIGDTPFPYEVVYHEYTHQLTSADSAWMPVWLNEGLAEFYQTADLEKGQVSVGVPDAWMLQSLRTAKLMPLPALFAVDHHSPYYHDANKADVFYEESWALTHMLINGDFAAHTTRLQTYMALLQRKTPPDAAATQAFGDLNKLQADLEAYIRQSRFGHLNLTLATSVDEKAFTARPRTQDQVDSLRAQALAAVGRTADARALVAAVLQKDPADPAANETMGWIDYHDHQLAAALPFLEKAVAAGSDSYLAQYLYGLALMENPGADRAASATRALESLRAAVRLNPQFAPAWDRLAMLLYEQGENLGEAYLDELHAVELEPGEFYFRCNAAIVLMRQQRFDDARAAIVAATALASSPAETGEAARYLAELDEYQRQLVAPRGFDNPRAVSVPTPATPGADPGPPPIARPAASDAPREARGAVMGISCAPPNINVAIDTGDETISFEASNESFAQFVAAHVKVPAGAAPVNACHDLNGRKVAIQYQPPANPDDPNVLLTLTLVP